MFFIGCGDVCYGCWVFFVYGYFVLSDGECGIGGGWQINDDVVFVVVDGVVVDYLVGVYKIV